MSNVETMQMPEIMHFRKILRSIIANDADSAVFARVIVQDMDAASKRLKEDADEILYNQKPNSKVTAIDSEGNEWAVQFIPQNQKQYIETPELKAITKELDEVKERYEAILAVTKFEMVRKGEKGYSYKVCKP